jgi:colanic acid/amylovoran biosynthesis glycosyltransferase
MSRANRMNGRERAPTVAYVFPAFPVLHQTFVLWEVLALRARSVPIRLYSLKRPDEREPQQPEAAALRAEVTYLPLALHPRVVWNNLKMMLLRPRAYGKLVRDIVREWHADRRRLAGETAREALTLRELLLGLYNTNSFLYLLKSLTLAWKGVDLGLALRREGVGHLHAHWASYPATVAYVVHRLYGIPYSFTAHAYDIYMMQYLLREKLRAARFVVTCASANANYLCERFEVDRRKLVVNYHGVDLRRFSHRSPPARAVPLVFSCGRLERYKGMHVLLQACARLAEDGLVFECRIVGEGPQRGDLEELVRQLGLEDRVHFVGEVPQVRLAEMMGDASVFVLASVIVQRYGKRDVIPNVLVEALASRVPVVASDVGGVRELVRDRQTGRLVSPGRPAALAAVIGELLRDPAQRERLGASGQRYVQQHFDREVNVEVLAHLMRAAVERSDDRVESLLAELSSPESQEAATA